MDSDYLFDDFLQLLPSKVPLMPAVDVYAITDKLDDTLLQVLARRLEARGRHPRFQAMLTEYLDAMNIDTARTFECLLTPYLLLFSVKCS